MSPIPESYIPIPHTYEEVGRVGTRILGFDTQNQMFLCGGFEDCLFVNSKSSCFDSKLSCDNQVYKCIASLYFVHTVFQYISVMNILYSFIFQ